VFQPLNGVKGGVPPQRVACLLGAIGTWPNGIRPPRGQRRQRDGGTKKKNPEASLKNRKRRKIEKEEKDDRMRKNS